MEKVKYEQPTCIYFELKVENAILIGSPGSGGSEDIIPGADD